MPADGGIRFGQYVLLRRIARGGMAEVFLAQQRGLEGFDRRVAVKRILPHLADSPDFVKMFLGEARLAAQLAHPNIVHIYEFGKVEQDYFIAMEYVDGIHAGQLFKHGEKLPATLIARIGADAAAALHYAHELRDPTGKAYGLVHRDVSPANLMVSFDGVVKLCDFGIAKAVMLSDQLTNPGQVKGKYAYMSPEQTIAAPLDGRSDVFSLAIVMWELLAGKFIVSRGDAVEAMRAIRDGKLDPIEKVAPDTPPQLAKALAWALEARREKRASAADLAQALEAFLKQAPDLATSMQLGAWVRARFPREAATGQHPPLTGLSPRTQVAPGTVAAPGTSAASRMQQPVTPQKHAAPATDLAAAPSTDLAPVPLLRRIVEETQQLYTSDLDAETRGPRDDTELDAKETALHTRTRPSAIGTATGAALPIPTSSTSALPRPRTPPPDPAAVRRAPGGSRTARVLLAIASLVALAVGSFLIALYLSGPHSIAPPLDAVAVPRDPSHLTMTPIELDAELAPLDAAPADAPPPPLDGPPEMLLEIKTTPDGALLRVAGQQVYAPAKIALPAGHYDVVAELGGYRAEHRSVELAVGDHPMLEIAFTHKLPVRIDRGTPQGRLTARTNPYSDVYEGLRKLGQTPFADLELSVGVHTLTFKNPSHPSVTRTIKIQAGREAKLQFDLP